MFRFRVPAATLAVALVASACSDTQLTTPENEGPAPVLSQSGGLQSAESIQDRLARTVPGFGGFFIDESDTPTAFLTDGINRGAAMQTLNAELRQMGLSRGDVRVLPAVYHWTELSAWHEQGTGAALAIDGVTWTDADESSNRVRIGVADLSAMAQVRGEMARLGIPAGALLIEQAAPIENMVGLRDVVTPKMGGIQIHFPGFLCTLGFNATAGGQASFITNSHCTNDQGGVVDPTPYWQPLQSVAGTQIATEDADPAYTSGGGCPAARVCRRSDASRAQYINNTQFALGKIARTQNSKNGSLNIVGDFTITDDDDVTDNFPIGITLNKVGRTTGWSSGRVSQTCVNTGVSGTNIVQFCQTFVKAKVNSGDSGSPTFLITSGTNVTLVGILWGGGGGSFVFSPLKNIESELGNLTVF
jgi:hypothetical protein